MKPHKQVAARGILVIAVLGASILADQISKCWAVNNLVVEHPQPLIPGLIRLNLTSNPGAAFSLGSEHGQLMGIIATLLTLLITGWIVKRIITDAPLPAVEQVGMGGLLGGALGNLIDRFTQGHVTDFLEFTFIAFPVFNVADSLIDIGIGLIFLAALFAPKPDKPPSPALTEATSAND